MTPAEVAQSQAPQVSSQAALDSTPGFDRTISPIAGRFGGGGAGKAVTLAALVVGCGIFGFATGHHPRNKSNTPVEPAAQVVSFEPAKTDVSLGMPTSSAPSPPILDPSTAASPTFAQQASAGAGAQSAEAAAQGAARTRAAQVQAIRAAPILAFNQGGGDLPGLPAWAPAPAAVAAAAHTPTELDQLRQGSDIGLARAIRLPDRHFLIAAGTTIPCTLQTAMDTATPGYVSCIVGQDVYSDDGDVVLMEKGAKVLGEYRSGMRQGQSRLFILWTRAVTPAGVAIGLASPASDALGRAGFDGGIDTHFWDRFGGALLLSIIDDTSAAVATRADSNGETVRVPSDAAGIALQNSINIPPSLKKAQGSQVAIFVAQDLDFSSVYALKAR